MSSRPFGTHGLYPVRTFAVPERVRAAALEGLALREKYRRGGTDVGRDRARQLAHPRGSITLRDAVYMRAYFRRHRYDRLDQRDPPSNGYIAWQLWGGHAADAWVERLVRDHLGY